MRGPAFFRSSHWTLLIGCLLASCASTPLGTPRPVPASALALAEEARTQEHMGDQDRVRELWQAASELDPSWLLPRRSLQLLDLADGRGPTVLEQAQLASARGTPGSAYLLARLASDNVSAYLLALHSEPEDAWLRHGLAVTLSREGRLTESLVEAGLAVQQARSSSERVFFLARLAAGLYIQDTEEGPALAFDRMLKVWQTLESDQWAWVDLSGQLLNLNVRGDRAAWQRSLASSLQGDARLSSALRKKVAALLVKDSYARTLLARKPQVGQPLDEGLSISFALDFSDGDDVERARVLWRKDLPPQATDSEGRPRDERLLAVDEALGELQLRRGVEQLRALGETLLGAGRPDWAERVADALHHAGARKDFTPIMDPAKRAWCKKNAEQLLVRARLLESRQTALRNALDDLGRGRLERVLGPDAAPKKGGRRELGSFRVKKSSGDMDQILSAMDARLGPYSRAASGDGREPRQGYGLKQSTRIDLWPILTGIAGADGVGITQPGLGALARDLGFYVQIVAPTGQNTQTRLARLVLQEAAQGELLGRPWQGTRILLGDVQSKYPDWKISGAALPDQYWVLLPEIVRGQNNWRSLAARFKGRPEAVQAALAQTGLLPASGVRTCDTRPGLGEAERLALAVMVSLGEESAQQLVVPSLEDLLDLTMRHEEGHMADYEEWLPPSEALFQVLSLFWQGGFSVRGIWAHLEARAQLTAMAVAQDPRLGLAQILRMVEARERTRGPTAHPHAEGYEWLLKKILLELKRNPRGLDPSRSLLHQLHLLAPQELAAVCLLLAEEEGLVRH
ncbi:MAG: hypothetical protein OSB42_10805 [Planctomycetota bacterium]|nr:hypothetical protein [Planctomycetota bacterium]